VERNKKEKEKLENDRVKENPGTQSGWKTEKETKGKRTKKRPNRNAEQRKAEGQLSAQLGKGVSVEVLGDGGNWDGGKTTGEKGCGQAAGYTKEG